MGTRFTRSINWFEIREEYIHGVIRSMYRNLMADLECGYNPLGQCIREQKRKIAEYENAYAEDLAKFREMSQEEINHYCFYDLKLRGAIE